MPTLVRAMMASPDEGKALPTPFEQWDEYGIRYRRGQVSLCASASGGGKSALAVHLALHARYEDGSKIPTQYFSCDTDKVTLGTRIGASILNDPVNMVEGKLRTELTQDYTPTWDKIEEETPHIWFTWDNAPSGDDIWEEVQAYGYINGAWPHLIIIDNLINVEAGGEAGHQQKDEVMKFLQKLAIKVNAHIMVLLHVTKEFVDGAKPIPKSGLLDAVDKRPRMILTLYRISESMVGVRVVKNSSGKGVSDASYGPNLAVDFGLAWMKG